jgi:hypothetical protein
MERRGREEGGKREGGECGGRGGEGGEGNIKGGGGRKKEKEGEVSINLKRVWIALGTTPTLNSSGCR